MSSTGKADTEATAPPRRCGGTGWHMLLFVLETCAAVAIGMCWCSRPCECPQLPTEAITRLQPASPAFTRWDAPAAPAGWRDASNVQRANHTALHNLSHPAAARRRLVANDFNADFSRRLSFHNWVEEDVILDRAGLEKYLRRALAAAGLARRPGRASRALRNTVHRPQSVEVLQRELGNVGFSFDTAYAAQAHHMLPGAPWSQGRDEFMHLVRHGLRPNHYFLGLGCGPLATGHHLVRYLLTGRYSCIEQDEYLLRAAVEYEIPTAGLIHKRPRFLLNDLAEVAALMKKPAAWLPDPPSYFDFVMVQRPVRAVAPT